MGLFNDAIQTLSEMAIMENGVELPKVAAPALLDEFKSTLDSLPSLTEEEMVFREEMVPIRESGRLQKYLIEMEDLSRYMITNGINDINQALSNICEANGIPGAEHDVALVIDEQSILDEMTELGFNVGDPPANPTGLGKGMLGDHLDIQKFRKFANSKEVIDTITNRYGLPVVKKKYSVGMVNESADIKAKPGDQVIQEKPLKDDKNSKKVNQQIVKEEEEPVMDAREAYLQHLRDIAAGKYDDEL